MDSLVVESDGEGLRHQDGDLAASHISLSHYATFDQSEPDDVDKLTNRISQLEHLVVTSNLTTSPFLDSSLTRLTPHGLIQRVAKLESLLAASELDNRRLENEVELLKASKQESDGEFYRHLKNKDNRIKNLEQDLQLSKTKLTKSEATITSMEEYIHTLPSQQELDDTAQLLSKSYMEGDILQSKVDHLEFSLKEIQKALAEKESVHARVLQRLDELQPLEEAQISILEGSQDETSLLELATIQKTQLLKATKIIKAQRRSSCDLETERAELLLQITEKRNEILSLQTSLTASQYQLDTTVKQLKASDDKKHELETRVESLENRISKNENWIRVRNHEMSNLLRLVAELDFTITDLKKLIAICQTLSLGEEPVLEDILGLDFDHEDIEDKTVFEIDEAWILEKLKEVRESHDNIKNMRTQVNEIYTDILGSNGKGCEVQ